MPALKTKPGGSTRPHLDGVLEERTSDYYTQDRCGNVWYFGEDTATLDSSGRVTSSDGSFHAGVNGAQPGVFMQAHPEVGRRFRQEWSPGQAEDTYTAIALSASVRVPAGIFRQALRTEESTALEPAVLDNKYYVRGIGEVTERSVKGPAEVLRLVEIISSVVAVAARPSRSGAPRRARLTGRGTAPSPLAGRAVGG